jgi:hypothetical protein
MGTINVTLNATIMTKIIGAIMINGTPRIIGAITITIIDTLGIGTVGAIGTTA